MKQQMDLMKLMEAFDTEAECREYLEGLRWPKGLACPRCKGETISRIQKRDQFDCDSCRYQFSVMSGTIFHDSHLPCRNGLLLRIFFFSRAREWPRIRF